MEKAAIRQHGRKKGRRAHLILLMVEMTSIATDLVEILVGCREGDRAAQHKLYERFHRRVYGLAARLVGHREAADLTQEIFLRVFTGLGSFRGSADFSTWLYRVAVNECLRYHRSARPVADGLCSEPQSRETPPDRRLEDTEAIEWALGCLEPPLRAVFLLRHGEEMNYKQISAVLDVPISTAATRLGRARAELQRLLKGIVQGS
jgi:RNA polymerase sigma-70 factor (ECF subfamily)